MNRKIILIALIAILSICIGVCVIACGNVHTHELEKIDAVASTCTTKGNIQYWHCKGCDKYFSDENAALAISKDDTLVDLDSDNHNYQTVSLDATCTQEGGERLVCSYDNSHFQVLESVPALGHDMKEDGVCSVCNNVVSKELRFELNEDGNSYTVYSIYSDMTSAADMKEKDIVIPAKYMGKPVTAIGEFAFSLSAVYDYNDFLFIESVTIPNTVTSIGECAFMFCVALKQVNIPDSVTKIGDCAFAACMRLNEIEIPASVAEFGQYVFSESYKLVHIVNKSALDLANGDIELGMGLNMSAVEICSDSGKFVNAIDVDDNGVQTYSVGDNIWLLDYLGNESTLDLSEYDNIYGVYEGAFAYSRLSSIILPSSVKEIGYAAFIQSELLEEVILPDYLDMIGAFAFQSCSSLNSIVIPDSVTEIGNEAFSYCDKLTAVKLPSSITEIQYNTFDCCELLSEITIPENVKVIGHAAFQNCRQLTRVILSDGIKDIESHAFWGCSGLESIILPDSITSISGESFMGCDNITFYCKVEQKPAGWDDYWNCGRPVVWGYKG